jgi:cysteine desulfurase
VEFLETRGFQVTRVPVDRQGFVDPLAVRAALREETILICVHWAAPDLGTIQPVAELAAVAADRGIPLLVDATAAAGWIPIDLRALPIDLLAMAPHRFFGPKGLGVLYRNRRTRLGSLIHGGMQEGGLRAGTENVPAVVGAGVAADLAVRDLAMRRAGAAEAQRRLWEGLSRQVAPVRLNGPPLGSRRLPHQLNLSIEFVEGEGLALALDLQGVAIHSGPACLSRSIRIPPALTAIGLSPALARSSVTLSPGPDHTSDSIDWAIERVVATVARLRGMSPLWEAYGEGRVASEIQFVGA